MHATIVNYNVILVSLNSNVQYRILCHVMFIGYVTSDPRRDGHHNLCNATTGKTHITGWVIYMPQLTNNVYVGLNCYNLYN